jgi:two-component system, OmpR family, phosphate regulon sensor histidine kinase PhoR
MKHSFRKIFILFLVILILPTLMFSIYEFGTLRENEKVIEQIYNNQLDAILFSVNQYSDDLMNSWAIRLDQSMYSNELQKNGLGNILKELPSAKAIFRFDQDNELISAIPDTLRDIKLIIEELHTLLNNNDTTLVKMKTYIRGGYRKLASFKNEDNKMMTIVFVSVINKKTIINILMVDPEQFINQVLDPKIQEIAQDKFYISAYNAQNELIYNSDKQFEPKNIDFKKNIWLINNYTLGIELKDSTIKDLAKTRSKRNLMLMVSLDLILLAGIWIIYRNVKKQIELSQLKSDFVSGVSHEIRTPLALISMYIETLDMGRIATQEKVKEYYGIILQETQRLSAIVNKILNFSQIESGRRKYSYSTIDINKIVCKVAANYKYILENKGFKFNIECAGELPQIKADPEALTDVVINLIDNAAKYSDTIKQITVRTGCSKNTVFLEVEDKGIGISKRHQKYIFDRFYRVVEKDLAHKAKGSGLGLSIVKHMVDAHRGKIVVNSDPGKGSCFRLEFVACSPDLIT